MTSSRDLLPFSLSIFPSGSTFYFTWLTILQYRYKNVILHLTHLYYSKVILTSKKVSWASFLGHKLLSIIPLIKKRVEIFLWQSQVPSEFYYQRDFFGVTIIINNQYIIWKISYFSNSTLDQNNINIVTSIFIQTWY